MFRIYTVNHIGSFIDSVWVQIGLTILLALVAQFVSRVTIRIIVHRILRSHKLVSAVDAQKRQETLAKMFRTAVAVVIWIIALLVALRYLNIDIGALATGAGFLGIIIGFGAQNSIKDAVAGMFIIAENQYRLGDIISVYANGKDISGVVEDVTIRITRLRDLDGYTHVISNGSIAVTTNLSFHFANVNLDIGVAYETDIDQAEEVINTVGQELSQDPKWKEKILEPIAFLRVDSFDESSVRLKCLGKVAPAQQWGVAGEFRRRLKKAFQKANIEIPFNQLVVHEHHAKK